MGGSGSSGGDSEDDVRLKAFALLNRLKDEDDDETTWPEKPEPVVVNYYSSYQKNTTPRQPNDDRQQPSPSSAFSSNDGAQHLLPETRYDANNTNTNSDYYEEWGIAGFLVSCIADACKKMTSSTEYNYTVRQSYQSIMDPINNAGEQAQQGEDLFEKVPILSTYQSSGEN